MPACFLVVVIITLIVVVVTVDGSHRRRPRQLLCRPTSRGFLSHRDCRSSSFKSWLSLEKVVGSGIVVVAIVIAMIVMAVILAVVSASVRCWRVGVEIVVDILRKVMSLCD